MKVLITGSGGQVGQALVRRAPAGAELIALGHDGLDIADGEAVQTVVETRRPDLIINAAAYTAVDKAESEPDAARRINETGPANLARAAASCGSRLFHISTDFVFDGERSAPYRPGDPTRPLSVYGMTKLAGENAVRQALGDDALILRTAWVYAASGRNFLLTMLRLMRERGSVRVVADQVGSPTSADSIAEALWKSATLREVSGTHHWTDSGVASWYDFAVAIAEEWARRTGAAAPATVIPITTADYPTPAKRPRFSVLDKTSTAAALGLTPRHWRQNLRTVIGEVSIA